MTANVTLILPTEAAAALRSLGQSLSRARRARGDTQKIAGERIGVHAQTIARIEQGDATVAVGMVYALLAMYGLAPRLFDLAKDDETTRLLAQKALPKRGRKRPSTAPHGVPPLASPKES